MPYVLPSASKSMNSLPPYGVPHECQPPAAYYTLYPRTNAIAPNNPEGNAQRSTTSRHSGEKQPQKKETLISKFNLERRITSEAEKIREDEIGGKAVWEDTAEKREASLRERKEKMVLAARQ